MERQILAMEKILMILSNPFFYIGGFLFFASIWLFLLGIAMLMEVFGFADYGFNK